MTDYNFAFVDSVFLTIPFLFIYSYIFKKNGYSIDDGSNIDYTSYKTFREHDESFLVLILNISLFFSLQMFIFVVWNTIWNYSNNAENLQDFIAYESSTGALSLRIASISVSFYTLYELIIGMRIFYKNSNITTDDTETYRYDIIIITQYTLYVLLAFMIWSILSESVNSTFVILVSTLLLFIVDDWVIISQYFRSNGYKILPNQFYKIQLFNIIFLLSVAYESIFYKMDSFPLLGSIFIFIMALIHYHRIISNESSILQNKKKPS